MHLATLIKVMAWCQVISPCEHNWSHIEDTVPVNDGVSPGGEDKELRNHVSRVHWRGEKASPLVGRTLAFNMPTRSVKNGRLAGGTVAIGALLSSDHSLNQG